eukprot:TRINITY_DN14359_c0_g2_i4.p1 TRINITY_DN14359_c0_g2~~TRINITY_DN14359_c0_g2_i4.p1  ORF type:complete len:536 (+),score=135.65 TRINITY_DN14359_c0_g2_i4:276-1883(+)
MAQGKKQRKKKKRKQLVNAIVCLDCFTAFCMEHGNAHKERIPIKVNTSNSEVTCTECNLNLRDLLRREEKDPIVEIVEEIVSAVAEEEEDFDYEIELKEFLRQIYSALGIKEDFDSDSNELTYVEYVDNPATEKELSDVFIDAPLEAEESEKQQALIAGLLGKNEIKGLRNVGNTCYFNSAMQCLNATHEFVKTILTRKVIPSGGSKSAPRLLLRKSMYEFIVAMRDSNKITHNPEHVLNAVRRKYKKFAGYHQQDSHELLISVIDRLIEEERELYKAIDENKSVTYFDTTISKVFASKLVNKITCRGCSSVYWIADPSIAYSLPVSTNVIELKAIRSKKKNKKRAEQVKEAKVAKELTVKDVLGKEAENEEEYKEVDINGISYLEPQKTFIEYSNEGSLGRLSDCFDFFFQKEILCEQNGNAFICSRCSGKSQHTSVESTKEPPISVKEYFIAEPPKVLIINLKRFIFGMDYARKNKKHIEIPFEFCLDKYLLVPSSEYEEGSSIANYSLYAIVSHSGTIAGGHYIAFVKSEDK